MALAIARWQRGQSLPAEVKPLAGGLLELRVQVGRDPYRAIFFKDTPVHDVCVLAVYKNQRRLPKSDLYLARQRMRQWKTEGF